MATTSAISSGFAARLIRATLALGEEIGCLRENCLRILVHNIAGADRVHVDAVFNTFDRQRTGELSQTPFAAA